MHLLYLDDSGSSGNQDEEYLVLGGVSFSEAQPHWATQQLDKLAETIEPQDPHSLEFHASVIFSGKAQPWKGMTQTDRRGVIKAVLKIVADAYESAQVFACAIHKESFANADPMELAFEDLCSRFDMYLSNLSASGDRQRGLLILDQSSYETSLQDLAKGFRIHGTRWGNIRNLADVPLFVNSEACRNVQLADHIAYAVFRRYNARDTQYFDLIAPKFYASGGVLHGLSHKTKIEPNCMCPACMSRRTGTSV